MGVTRYIICTVQNYISRQLTENTLATEVGVSCSRAISTVWAPSREIRTVSWIANLEAIVTRGQETL